MPVQQLAASRAAAPSKDRIGRRRSNTGMCGQSLHGELPQAPSEVRTPAATAQKIAAAAVVGVDGGESLVVAR
jgi:hypothetical protein